MIRPAKKNQAQFDRLAREKKYPDFIKIETALKGSIKVEDINELDNVLCYPPFESFGRVIYISDAGSMTAQAQNALLKKLEEPPAGNFFILTTKKKNSLLPTIISRTVSIFHSERIDNSSSLSKTISDFFPFISEMSLIYGEGFVEEQIELSKQIAELMKEVSLLNVKLAENLFVKNMDEFAENEKDSNLAKNRLFKTRLALTAFFIREIYPESSAKMIKFLENKQFFSIDSMVFFNIRNIISNLLR